MRELSMIDTAALAALLLLSLVLPLLIGIQTAAVRSAGMRWVWTGALLALAGTLLLASATLVPLGLLVGIVGCAACAALLLRTRKNRDAGLHGG